VKLGQHLSSAKYTRLDEWTPLGFWDLRTSEISFSRGTQTCETMLLVVIGAETLINRSTVSGVIS
jgi:hypothetical protein